MRSRSPARGWRGKACSSSTSGSTTWPDGTRAELYAFRHDLYRELLYDRLPATRRAREPCARRPPARSRLGRPARRDRGGAGRAFRARQRACARDPASPARRRQGIAPQRQCRRRSTTCGVRSMRSGTSPTRSSAPGSRSSCASALGAAFMATRGFGAPEVLEAYSRAEALCDRLGERADLFPAIWGQWMFRTGRSETIARAAARRAAARRWRKNSAMPV